jgi:hypothetical protein
VKRAGTAQREANRVAGRHPTRLIGVLTVAFGIGQVAVPIVAATLAIRHQGFDAPLALAALASAALVTALVTVRHRSPQRLDDGASGMA